MCKSELFENVRESWKKRRKELEMMDPGRKLERMLPGKILKENCEECWKELKEVSWIELLREES